MQRRTLLGGLAALLLPPAAAVAQPPPPGYAPPPPAGPSGAIPPGYAPVPMDPSQGRAGGAAGAPRERVALLNWDQISPRRQRKLAQRLAGPNRPPLAPDQARAMWDGMTPQQRRQAARRQPWEPERPGNPRRQQQMMGQPPQ